MSGGRRPGGGRSRLALATVLGRRVFAIEGGPASGLTHSRAIEYLDVPRSR
jgi:hypothetical protein